MIGFNKPTKLSPFYGDVRIPRKLKKEIKKYCGIHFGSNSVGQNMWHYLDKRNPEYKKFLIKSL